MVGRWWSCYTQMGRVWGATAPEAREAPGQELRMNQTCSITQHSRTLSPATAADIHCGRGVLCHRDTHPAKDSVQIKCQSTDMLRSSCSHRSKHNTFPRPQQHDSPPDCNPVPFILEPISPGPHSMTLHLTVPPYRASPHLCLSPHSLPSLDQAPTVHCVPGALSLSGASGPCARTRTWELPVHTLVSCRTLGSSICGSRHPPLQLTALSEKSQKAPHQPSCTLRPHPTCLLAPEPPTL